MARALVEFGANPGRSGHAMSMRTADRIYRCRERAAAMFGPVSYTHLTLNMGAKFTAQDGSTPYKGLKGDDVPDDVRIQRVEEVLDLSLIHISRIASSGSAPSMFSLHSTAKIPPASIYCKW